MAPVGHESDMATVLVDPNARTDVVASLAALAVGAVGFLLGLLLLV